MARKPNKPARDTASSSPVDRLRLRVSSMIQSPRAQALRRATIWRVDGDTSQAWAQLLEDLREVDGLEAEENDDGTITLSWEAMPEEGPEVELEELDPLLGMRVEQGGSEGQIPF